MNPLGEAQHINRTVHASLGRLNRIELVVNGRCRTSQVKDTFDLDVYRECYVMAQGLKQRFLEEMRNVDFGAGEVVINAKHIVLFFDKAFAKVRANETCTTGNQYLICHTPLCLGGYVSNDKGGWEAQIVRARKPHIEQLRNWRKCESSRRQRAIVAGLSTSAGERGLALTLREND